jgi:hypothetical protein
MARPTKQYGKQYGKKATVVEVVASPPPQNKRKRAVSTELGEEEDGSYDSDSVIEESDSYVTRGTPLSSQYVQETANYRSRSRLPSPELPANASPPADPSTIYDPSGAGYKGSSQLPMPVGQQILNNQLVLDKQSPAVSSENVAGRGLSEDEIIARQDLAITALEVYSIYI